MIDPSRLDRAGIPASTLEFRAWHPQTQEVIMLEQPELIQYYDGYQLQKRDADDPTKWDTFLLSADPSDEDTHQEDIG